MDEKFLEQLHQFIVQAKTATYVGNGSHTASHRPKSHDLAYENSDFSYLDSYFGGSDFIGEEVVYYKGEPIWAENYYGRIIEPNLLTASEAGQMIKVSLSKMYAEGRFLGGFQFEQEGLVYMDTSKGDISTFNGLEWIEKDGTRLYELVYHGGLIRD
ncbi:MAG: hypothetical protein JEZ00_21510 [Anaerolineaceae bacterium]|nr:hypothetical protein [Anaerolineaceae bacterium]